MSQSRFDRWFSRIEATIYVWLGLCANFMAVFSMSALFTWLIRRFWLPTAAYVELPLNFAFHTCESTLSDVCSFPTANVTLRFPNALDDDDTSILASGVPYELQLSVELTEVAYTQQMIGVFMCVVRCLSFDGALVSTISRSFSLRSSVWSWLRPLRWLKLIIFWPFWLIGYFDEHSRVFEFVLADRFHDSPVTPVQYMSLQLQNKYFQIIHASLHVRANLDPISSFLYHWPLLSTSILFCFIGLCLSLCSAVYWMQRAVFCAVACADWLKQQRRNGQQPADQQQRRTDERGAPQLASAQFAMNIPHEPIDTRGSRANSRKDQ